MKRPRHIGAKEWRSIRRARARAGDPNPEFMGFEHLLKGLSLYDLVRPRGGGKTEELRRLEEAAHPMRFFRCIGGGRTDFLHDPDGFRRLMLFTEEDWRELLGAMTPEEEEARRARRGDPDEELEGWRHVRG